MFMSSNTKSSTKQGSDSNLPAYLKKPDEIRDRIVQLFGDISRIELFARQRTEGWNVWGNQLPDDANQETT